MVTFFIILLLISAIGSNILLYVKVHLLEEELSIIRDATSNVYRDNDRTFIDGELIATKDVKALRQPY